MTTNDPPPCTLRRSDGKQGHEHWLKSKNKSLLSPSKHISQITYKGSCHCHAIQFEFRSAALDLDTTFYTCECNACFKRGYHFYVVSPDHFRYTSRLPSDLGTYATETGSVSSCNPALITGSFLHCFCGRCGSPLWVECDGIFDSAISSSNLRETLKSGFATIGVNMRALNNLGQEVLENAHVRTYRDIAKEGCILDETAIEAMLS